MSNNKCIIFGAGNMGNMAYRFLKREYEIIGFADNNSKRWGEVFCGKLIYNPDELKQLKAVEVIIASIYYASIYKQLKEMGIINVTIFFYIGNAINDAGDKYKLYQIPDTSLFSGCKFDRKKAEAVQKDFTQNYSLNQRKKENILEIREKKQVLFCAYIFPPSGGGGVQRSLKFVKYLRKFGYEPIVLTVGRTEGMIIEDNSMLAELEDDIKVIRIDYNLFLPELMSKEEQQEIFNLYMGVTQSENWMNEYQRYARLIPDNKIVWVNQCLKRIEEIIDLRDIDVVYTTGNPFSTYFLGYYIKNKYETKWVMDYRDPWMSNDFYVENFRKAVRDTVELQQQLENKLVSLCDHVIGAADFKEDFVKKYNIEPDKFVEITNGYDEGDFRGIEIKETKNEKFTLCHNGRLYGNRNPVYLLRAINHLIEEKRIDSDKIQWIWNGSIEEPWKGLLYQEDLYNVIHYNGYLNHKESIVSAISSDLLILFGLEGKGTKIGYNGKLFEYLRMKKPILSFSTKGGILDSVFQKTHSGSNFDYQDENGIAEYLLKQYYAWEQDISVLHPNEEEIQKYSREFLTSKLVDVFNQILD